MQTIVIAEDHALLRSGLTSLISENNDLSVVGEAEDGLEAIALVQKHVPDLVLMDLSMPRFGGIESIKKIKQLAPKTRILVVSMHATDKHIKAALQAGADGYLLKMDKSSEFIVAIRSVLAGDGYISSKLASKVLNVYSSRQETEWTELELLTNREKEILKLVAEGHTSKELAELLSISPKTADNHRANILRKLGLRNIHELTRFAREHDLVVD